LNAALKLAREYGITISFADLGDWGIDELRSEYDPRGPAIRINIRIAEMLYGDELYDFITRCIGHELYHHREAIGEIPALPERRDREIAADSFARRLLEPR
jgi:hypothetical protein